MNKSNVTLSVSTSIFLLLSFFVIPVSVVNAEVSLSEIKNIQACGLVLAAEEKKDGKEGKDGKKGKDEEEPDCE
jgi:hypothetical protein